MFVFLSPQSAESKWIYFEAGCAYAKEISVVPVCLPGIDLNRITPPLSLLHGFNLHSHEAIGNLARICNETFQLKIDESFSQSDFESVVANSTENGAGFFGNLSQAVDSIVIYSNGVMPSDDFDPIPALKTICNNAGIACHIHSQKIEPTTYNSTIFSHMLELPGCIGKFYITQPPLPKTQQRATGTAANPPAVPKNNYSVSFTLSPELFSTNAALLDQWCEQIKFGSQFTVRLQFKKQIRQENRRHSLTTKLFKCGITTAGLNAEAGFIFDGLKFQIDSLNSQISLSFVVEGKCSNKVSSVIVDKLFTSEVLWEHQPDLSEMFQD